MTQAHERTATLSQLVGKQIKLKLFLADMSGRDLAGKLGVSPSWVSYRLSGKQEIGLDDLLRIATALDVGVGELMTPEIIEKASQGPEILKQNSGTLPQVGDLRTGSHVSTHPFAPGRRDSVRPVSAVPANKRRPALSRPANRPMAV